MVEVSERDLVKLGSVYGTAQMKDWQHTLSFSVRSNLQVPYLDIR